MIKKYCDCIKLIEKGKSALLFLIRLVLAYGFYGPAVLKWKDTKSVADWFGSIGIPIPIFSAYLAAYTEVMGVLLLILGLATRFIAIPLIFTMLVAILTVHLANGFEASQNGFEIPLYYIILLTTLIIFGPGKWSIDQLILRKISKK